MVTAFSDRSWVENTYIKKCPMVTIAPKTLCTVIRMPSFTNKNLKNPGGTFRMLRKKEFGH